MKKDKHILDDYIVRDDSGNVDGVSVAGMKVFLSNVRDFYTVENNSETLSLLNEMEYGLDTAITYRN